MGRRGPSGRHLGSCVRHRCGIERVQTALSQAKYSKRSSGIPAAGVYPGSFAVSALRILFRSLAGPALGRMRCSQAMPSVPAPLFTREACLDAVIATVCPCALRTKKAYQPCIRAWEPNPWSGQLRGAVMVFSGPIVPRVPVRTADPAGRSRQVRLRQGKLSAGDSGHWSARGLSDPLRRQTSPRPAGRPYAEIFRSSRDDCALSRP